MLTEVHPKLPMRVKEITLTFYKKLGFDIFGYHESPDYLMMERDQIQIHFFGYPDLDIYTNYGQIYFRTDNIRELYSNFQEEGVQIHPNGKLQSKPWGITEFSILDPDHNLIIFGQNTW